MAAKAKADGGDGAKSPGLLIPLLVMTLLSGAAGSGYSFVFVKPPPAETEAEPQPAAKPAAETVSLRFPGETVSVPLSPIVTNLATAGLLIRLEGTLLLAKEAKDGEVVAAEISEDITSYLRTLAVSDLEGARGFQNLREDLNDRARIRSNGEVRGIVIYGLVIE